MFSLRTEHDRATSIIRIEPLERIRESADEGLVEKIGGRATNLESRDEIVADLDTEVGELLILRHALISS
jgi:hypothetical protein